METLEDVLAHHGIKGMKWGVRRARTSSGRVVSEDVKSVDALKTKVKKAGGTHVLTNQELKKLNDRLNLEQNHSRLTATGNHFAAEFLKKQGTQLAAAVAQEAGRQYIVNKVVKKP